MPMKYQVVQQYSEEDCGAACLASIAKYYERNIAMNRVREAVGTGQLGTTMLGLIRQGAESLGFNARSVKAPTEILDQMHAAPLPAIIHWKGNHWVVLYGKRGKKYVIADPATNIRYLDRKELMQGWRNWVMLLLEPDPVRFYDQSEDRVHGIVRFIRRVWPYRALLLQVLVCVQVIGLLSLATPFLMQILMDDVLVRGDTELLTTVVIAVAAMNIFSKTLGAVTNNLIAHFAERLELGLVLEFGRSILRLPLIYYETHRSGEIISRLQDIQSINNLVSRVVLSLPSQFFIAVVSFCLMLFYSGKLTLVAVSIAILMTLSTFVFLPIIQQKARKILVLDAENQGVLVESFKGAIAMKTTTAAPQFWGEFQSRFGRLANQTFSMTQIGIMNSTFSGLVSGLGSLALLWFGSTLVIRSQLTIGQLVAFNTMNANFVGLIGTVVSFINEFAEVKVAIARLTEVIDATPENQGEPKKPWVEIPDDADIICSNLNFHYPGRMDLLKEFFPNHPWRESNCSNRYNQAVVKVPSPN